MLPLHQRLAFAVFAVVLTVMSARGFYRMYLRVRRGRADADGRVDDVWQRALYALRTTLLQTRVFRARRVLSVFHSFIFYAFVLYLVVNAVDAVDGYVDLRPVGSAWMRALYGVLTDAFSVLAIAGVLAFVVRRYALRARRDFAFNGLTLLQGKVKRGYVRRDSAIVSAFIVLHIGSRVVGNAARLAMEGVDRWEPFGSWLAPVFAGPHAMVWRELGYWGALGSVLLFGVYFPYSKHVHLFMAPVKYFFRRDVGSGVLPLVKVDVGAEELHVGAARLADLSWPRLLDAYACIQCNRCQDVCPASQTGKALSPAALEINKRMVLNGIAEERSAFALAGTAAFERGTDAGPLLMEAVLSPEAVWACTTCGACMEVCPTQDEQMLDIIDMRRNAVMVEGEFPAQLVAAFRGMERMSNPWGLAREKRMAWADGLHVPTVDEVPDPEVLYWVGCAASYDAGAQKTARAVVQLLAEAGVSFAVLGKRECCTGDSARRAGNELLYQQIAGEAVAVLQDVKPKTVLASCPHCVNTIEGEYPQFGGNFNVVHHTEFLARLVDEGRLQPVASEARVTFHDPCYLGRHRGTYEQPRNVLHVLSNDVVEMPRAKNNAFCCGAGGAQFWKEEERGTERVAENRFSEAEATLAGAEQKVLAVGCPFCKSMLASSTAAGATDAAAVKDVAELLWEGVQRAKEVGANPAMQSEAVVQEVIARIAPVVVPQASAAALSDADEGPVIEAVTVVQEPAATPEPEVGPVARKKWMPRGAAATKAAEADVLPAVEPVVQKVSEEPASESTTTSASPVRRKWTPKGAAAPAEVTEAPEASASGAATVDSAAVEKIAGAVAEPLSSGDGGPVRKKWQPRKVQ